jgi:hypothetical protein
MNPENEMKALVTKYRVCWSVYPEKAFVDEKLRQIGFRLELYGTHPPDVGHLDPGCVHCREVWAALKRIAAAIIPDGSRDSEYDIETFDDALHYSKQRKNRAEVELHIDIIHKSGFGPVDECENRCLKEMTDKLVQLGARQDHWEMAV